MTDDSEPAPEARVPIGMYLAQQRELRGIALEQLAEITRIPYRSLERLESGQFDDDSDGFVRGFVRTVAIALGLDPVDTVARMLSEPTELGTSAPRISPQVGLAVAGVIVLILAVVLIGQLVASVGELSGSASSAPVVVERLHRVDAVRALADRAEAGRAAKESVAGVAGADETEPVPQSQSQPQSKPQSHAQAPGPGAESL